MAQLHLTAQKTEPSLAQMAVRHQNKASWRHIHKAISGSQVFLLNQVRIFWCEPEFQRHCIPPSAGPEHQLLWLACLPFAPPYLSDLLHISTPCPSLNSASAINLTITSYRVSAMALGRSGPRLCNFLPPLTSETLKPSPSSKYTVFFYPHLLKCDHSCDSI